MRRVVVDVVSHVSAGTATVYSPRVSGLIHSIHYVKDGTTPFTDGVDFTVTIEATGQNLWTESDVNASTQRAPRQPTHTQVGVASLYAAAGTAVNDRIAVGNDRVKIVLAQAGNSKLGRFIIMVDN